MPVWRSDSSRSRSRASRSPNGPAVGSSSGEEGHTRLVNRRCLIACLIKPPLAVSVAAKVRYFVILAYLLSVHDTGMCAVRLCIFACKPPPPAQGELFVLVQQ